MDFLIGWGNDEEAQSVLYKISVTRKYLDKSAPNEGEAILSMIVDKIELAMEQYPHIELIKRLRMTKHLDWYSSVMITVPLWTYHIESARQSFGGFDDPLVIESLNWYIQTVVAHLKDILDGIPMPGEAFDETCDLVDIGNTLRNSRLVMSDYIARRTISLLRDSRKA
ncbi:hypothetical protein FS837_010410 [Tulasnella sp. UAMH 9824]|nr:hypothetical protein FS837_010410 [Tulasnella sp. UAMH 9824]